MSAPSVAPAPPAAPTPPRRTTRRAARRVARRVSPFRLVGGTLVVWLLLAVASVAWWPIYRNSGMLVAAVTAVVFGTLIALLGAVLRLPTVVVAVATVAAFTLTGVPAAVPGQAAGLLPTGHGLLDLYSGVALGWKRLITISLPVGTYEALLVPFFVTLLVATVTAVSVATRASRQELASIPALVLFAAGVVVGPSRLDTSIVVAVALTAIALVWAVTVRHARRAVAVAETIGAPVAVGRSVLRPALVGTGTVVAAAVVATGLGLVAPPSTPRTVARTDVVKPFDPRDYVSPLSGFRAYEESTEAETTQLRVTGLPENGFVRIATLDTYDGVTYRVGGTDGASASGTFERVPTSVDVRGVRGTTVHVGVTVDGYSGVWLPTVGDLERVEFGGSAGDRERGSFFYNASTGTGAVLGGVDDGTRYDLTAVVPDQPTDEQLAKAQPGDAAVPAARNVPDAVRDTVESTTSDAGSDGAKLIAMIRALKQNGYISHGVGDDRVSRSGHGADRIQELLTSPLMLGDQEQYAVAAALMAEDIGFPTRVVLGFAAGGDSGTTASTSGSAGTTTFRGSDVTARIEVDTAQWGWVTINPNPAVREIPAEQQQTPKPVTRPETVVPPPPADQQDQDQQAPPQSDRNTPDQPPLWLQILLAALPWVIGTLAFVALVLLPFGVIVLVKRVRRRRRRRAATARARITGAWDEYRDALLDRGEDVPVTATRREVAVSAPGDGGSGLAALADRAVFGPSDADDRAADRMWDATDTAIGQLREGRTRRQRIRTAVSVRSLRTGPAAVARVGRAVAGRARAVRPGRGADGDYDVRRPAERRSGPDEDRGNL
ncbi:ABC-type nitrate/sulfonate/bicarbonate transport system permease component [Curtobacterium sp. PhB130]|uniref:transglutaminaseTgpA domain-containing protein n=1 Tax=unclassified Curtobacterium TaxID=257496 RepID=UPI000F4C411F|nr:MULTISPECIES: transglutaminaseTgpA domain-containing protein [unclassified Curtobacterium]ROS73191.1 ABC-type nitrate/sulfonate/bicarbonate transport system permease component [Curtobacterium sp. PhB130]TCK61229.1 ABC-type nitrate/sulfonate/bicarbonate transport system permease component [Curtobacterium sp. PhB136]